jgi:cytoskeleton protein RodZ
MGVDYRLKSMKVEEPISPSPMELQRIGDQFKQVRQDKSLSLEEVTVNTKISRSNLHAIESMEYDKLPADSFTRGQIILYGVFLGMDGRAAADRFFTERDGGKKNQISFLQKSLRKQPLTSKKLAEPTHVSSAALAGILLMLIVLSFTGFCLYFSWNPFAFLTDKAFNLSSSTSSIFHPADPATSNGSPHKPLKLSVLFRKDSRVTVSLDNKQSFEQQYTKGTSAHWEAEKQLQLEFSQPDSAELQLNGTPLPFPDGTDGSYRLNIPAPPPAP